MIKINSLIIFFFSIYSYSQPYSIKYNEYLELSKKNKFHLIDVRTYDEYNTNRLKNAKRLSKEGLAQEGFNILTGAIGRIGGTADSAYGIPNTYIGRTTSNIKNAITIAKQRFRP